MFLEIWRTFSNNWELTKAGCVYLDLDDRGFIRGNAEHRAFINLLGKPRWLVYVLHLNCDLREKKMNRNTDLKLETELEKKSGTKNPSKGKKVSDICNNPCKTAFHDTHSLRLNREEYIHIYLFFYIIFFVAFTKHHFYKPRELCDWTEGAGCL